MDECLTCQLSSPLMLYDSDPFNPDPAEIARVTDYIVAYASKGNVSLADEKKQIRRLITRCTYANKGTSANCCIFAVYSHPSFFYCSMSDDTGSQLDVIRLSRHLLNRAASNHAISKQECMVLLSGLDLVMCSESIEWSASQAPTHCRMELLQPFTAIMRNDLNHCTI